MGYKYRQGDTPDHVNSDDSNSTAQEQHNLSTKADATATNIPKSAMSADDKVVTRDVTKARAKDELDNPRHDGGFEAMFAHNRAKNAQEDLDKANSNLPPTMKRK